MKFRDYSISITNYKETWHVTLLALLIMSVHAGIFYSMTDLWYMFLVPLIVLPSGLFYPIEENTKSVDK